MITARIGLDTYHAASPKTVCGRRSWDFFPNIAVTFCHGLFIRRQCDRYRLIWLRVSTWSDLAWDAIPVDDNRPSSYCQGESDERVAEDNGKD